MYSNCPAVLHKYEQRSNNMKDKIVFLKDTGDFKVDLCGCMCVCVFMYMHVCICVFERMQ